jgi:hypothetical protein
VTGHKYQEQAQTSKFSLVVSGDLRGDWPGWQHPRPLHAGDPVLLHALAGRPLRTDCGFHWNLGVACTPPASSTLSHPTQDHGADRLTALASTSNGQSEQTISRLVRTYVGWATNRGTSVPGQFPSLLIGTPMRECGSTESLHSGGLSLRSSQQPESESVIGKPRQRDQT